MILNTYECINKKCTEYGKEKEEWTVVGAPVYCIHCGNELNKVWKVGAVKTGDGFKK